MINKITSVNQIEVIENGTVQVRISLMLEENGIILSNKWHRTAFPPETPVDLQISAVNQHLAEMGYNPVATSDVDKVKAICNASWTPEIVSAYRLINQ